MNEVKKAIELNPKSASAWLSRGVGNYYLPERSEAVLRWPCRI